MRGEVERESRRVLERVQRMRRLLFFFIREAPSVLFSPVIRLRSHAQSPPAKRLGRDFAGPAEPFSPSRESAHQGARGGRHATRAVSPTRVCG